MRNKAFFVAVILLPLSISFFSGTSKAEPDSGASEMLLPAWFWDSPEVEGVEFAVGYSPSYRDSPTAYRKAFEDAALRLLSDRRSSLICRQGLISTPYGLRTVENENAQAYDTSNIETFYRSLVMIDSIRTDDLRLVLIATRPANVNQTRVKCPNCLAVDSTGKRLQGYGVSPRYLRLSSTWIEAEGMARIELAMSFAKISGTIESQVSDAMRGTGSKLSSVYELSSNVELRNVKTIHRRLNHNLDLFEVWATGNVFDAN